MPLVDVTGKDPSVPVCPKHNDIALIHESKPSMFKQGSDVRGYWRCPVDNRVYANRSDV